MRYSPIPSQKLSLTIQICFDDTLAHQYPLIENIELHTFPDFMWVDHIRNQA